ncbi:MAG: TlpA disulfide reductase family protein [Alphaproteobacteria bacterium]|jgi:thiol-disulfide isomerase/thioredoxin
MGHGRFSLSRRVVLAGIAAPFVGAGRSLAGQIKAIERDIAAPALSLPLLSGGLASLDSFPTQPVIVAFWATWCVPCRAELPALSRLNDSQMVRVFAVNAGEPEARIAPFVDRIGLQTLPIVIDPHRRAMVDWRVTALPTAYIVGPDRRIKFLVLGDIDWESDAVRDQIAALQS